MVKFLIHLLRIRPINIHTVDTEANNVDSDRVMGDSDRDSSTYSQVMGQKQIR